MKIKMEIYSETVEDFVNSEAELDIMTGKISNVIYKCPYESYNYEKHNVMPSNIYLYKEITKLDDVDDDSEYGPPIAEALIDGKKISFKISANKKTSSFFVKEKELENIRKQIEDLNPEKIDNSLIHKIEI